MTPELEDLRAEVLDTRLASMVCKRCHCHGDCDGEAETLAELAALRLTQRRLAYLELCKRHLYHGDGKARRAYLRMEAKWPELKD
jgi:hypothetical protein